MKVTRLAGALGAEVTNFDLKNILTREDTKVVQELLTEHSVLFFPNQHLSIDQHISLGKLFGNLEGHPNLKNPNEMTKRYPELFELHASRGGIANEWHTDLTFRPFPAKMSILKMVSFHTYTKTCGLMRAYYVIIILPYIHSNMCAGACVLL